MHSQHPVGAQALWENIHIVVCFTTGANIFRTVNSGNLLTTVHESRLLPVRTSILHLYIKDKVTNEEAMMVTLTIGYDLTAPTPVPEHVVFYSAEDTAHASRVREGY